MNGGKRNWNIYIDNRSTSLELGVLHKFARSAFILSLFLLLLLLFSISFHARLSRASLFIFICLYFKSIWHGCCVLKTWNGNQNECALWMNELICDSRNCSTKLSYQISFDEIWIEWNSGTRPERSDPMPRKKVVAQMKWFVENDWFNRMFLCVLPSQVIWDSRSKAIYGSTQHTSSHFKENSKSKFNKNK